MAGPGLDQRQSARHGKAQGIETPHGAEEQGRIAAVIPGRRQPGGLAVNFRQALFALAIAAVLVGMSLPILETAHKHGMREPHIAKPLRSDTQLGPDRRHCAGLSGNAWVNCILP